VAAIAIATGAAFALNPFFVPANLVMIYLLATVAVAARGFRGPAAFSSLLGVLCFDFFFVPPRFTLAVSDVQYVWTFAGMFTTAMIISHLTVRLREEAEAARQQEHGRSRLESDEADRDRRDRQAAADYPRRANDL
jgi:two-component system, OmpR family, sensor histidine kinase KdpD